MKNVTRRGFIGLSASAALAAALAGCSSGGSSASSSASSASASSEAASSSAASSSASASASAAASAAASAGALRFVTGGESGTYYAFGSVIAQHATNNAGLDVTALVGNGSAANIAELEDGNAELAFCQSDVMAYAFEGSEQWKSLGSGAPVTCYSTVAALYDETVQIVTCNPDIKTVEDLKGKNVSIGAAGSGVYFNAIDILGAYGLAEADINPTFESFADTANSIKDGKIDAGFVVAGAPTTAITELSTSKQAYLVALDKEHVDKLVAASPYYSAATIPAGTYSGIDEDIATVSVQAVILANDSVAEDDVYKLVVDIFDNAASLVETHAKYGEIDLDKGASITTVPYHPGAAKYFGEKGKTVATK